MIETYWGFFALAAVLSYLVSMMILAFGRLSWDVYVLALPVGAIVGFLAMVWVATLRHYTPHNNYDPLLALFITALLTVLMAHGRLEWVAHDKSLRVARRRGVYAALAVLVVTTLLCAKFWLVPKFAGFYV